MTNFYLDVIRRDPRYASTQRCADISLLEPITREKVCNIIAKAASHSIRLKVWETYRSEPRQIILFNQKATKLRTVGVHHYGLAADIVKWDLQGEPSWKGDFSFLGELAKEEGLVWGGNWGTPNQHHSFVDADHVQRCTVAEQQALFAGKWYP